MKRLFSVLVVFSLPLLAVAAPGAPGPSAKAPAPAAPAAQMAEAQKPAERPRHPPLVIEEKQIDPKHVDKALMALARAAHKAHKRVLVEFSASWCVACEVLKPVFWRPGNQALFQKWELVQVDVDLLPDGPVLGIPFDSIPFFMKLDSTGHVVGTLKGGEVLGGHPTDDQIDAAFARFLRT